jgi:DNA-binding NtrC family response regulator
VSPHCNVILFVEDEAMLHVAVEPALADVGFGVAGALSAHEAVQILNARPLEICALVTDVDLGAGLDGWALAKIARGAIADLPVIYASASSEADVAAEQVTGATFVGKPYDAGRLACLVRAILARPSSTGGAHAVGKGDAHGHAAGALDADVPVDLLHQGPDEPIA